jgi:hypothetical protein
LTLGGSATPLVHIIQYNIDQDICRVIDAGTLEREGSKLLGKSVPTKKLPEIYVAHLERLYVLEHIQWHCGVEGKLLVALDEPGSPVW